MKKYSAMAPGDAPTVFYALPELHYPDRLNAVERLLEDAITRGWGARTAYLHHGRAISYDELRRDVHRTAIALRRIGIVAGDRVLLRLEDGPELVAAVLAAQAIGACVVPTYVQLRTDGLVTRANDCGAVAAIVSASLLDEFVGVPEQCPALVQTIVVPADPIGRLRAMDAIRPQEATEFAYADTDRDDVALILYTSGSSGRPKGTLHNHADLLAICDTYARHCVGLRPDDIVAGPAAIPFALGIGFFIYFPLRFGAAAVLEPDKSPEALVGVLARTGATILVGVSTYYNRLGRVIVAGKLAFPALRMTLCGGEPLPGGDRAGMARDDGIGARAVPRHDRAPAHRARHPPRHRPAEANGDRPARPRVRGLGASSRDLRSGRRRSPGLLAVRGATGTCYLDRPEAQLATVREGWNVFQDIVRADADGFIHYIGRYDDMIVTAGHSIAPAEVEQILLTHPDVVECACVAARDRNGERPTVVMAFVVTAPTVLRSDETKRHLQEYFKRCGPPACIRARSPS